MFVSWRARPMSEPAKGGQTVRIGQADTASKARFRLDSPQQTALLLDRLHTHLLQTGRT